MARIKRRGEAFYPSSGTLPPTQERVHRLQELDSGRSRTLSDLLTGVWGEAPYQPTTLPRLQSQGFVAPPPPLQAHFTAYKAVAAAPTATDQGSRSGSLLPATQGTAGSAILASYSWSRWRFSRPVSSQGRVCMEVLNGHFQVDRQNR